MTLMKKTLLACAALAVAGAASAQSSVTLFGIVDTVLNHGSGTISDKTQVTHSGHADSRLGFRGTEDLGGGLSASFWLEMGINSDDGSGQATNTNNQTTGTGPAGALMFNRRSTVSLAGSWGEVRLGRDYVPAFWNLTIFDPFGTKGTGGNVMLSSIITGPTAARASNSIGYFLPPNLGGFYGQAMYFVGENPSGAATSDDGKGYGVRVGFARAPFNVAVATTRTQLVAGDARQTNLAAEWSAGFAKIQGQLSRDSRGTLDAKGMLFGAVVPVGAGEVRAAVSRYSTDAAGDPAVRKLALGYVHHLSKRTLIYTTWARVRNSGGFAVALNGSATAPNGSSSGYDLGIRHNF